MTRDYPFVDTELIVAGRVWRLSCVGDQDTLIAQIETEEDLLHFPFGLLLWASAVGLSERLCERPDLVAGKRVLELGAGVGLVGLVARHLGADVVQSDYHPDALAICRENAARNGIDGITVRTGDWRDWPADLVGFDLVLGADILYERTLHPALRELLPRLVRPGGRAILADPLRPQALSFVESAERAGWQIATEGRRVDWEDDPRDIALFFVRFDPAGTNRETGCS